MGNQGLNPLGPGGIVIIAVPRVGREATDLSDPCELSTKPRESWPPGGFNKAAKFGNYFQLTRIPSIPVFPAHQTDREFL